MQTIDLRKQIKDTNDKVEYKITKNIYCNLFMQYIFLIVKTKNNNDKIITVDSKKVSFCKNRN